MTKKALTEIEALEAMLEIDEGNLVQAWHDQPKLYVKVSRYAARCEAAVEEAKVAVKTVFAQKFKAIRDTETEKGDRRKSDEYVKQIILADEEYQKVEMFRCQMVERYGIASGLQEACRERQYSLVHISKKSLGGDLDRMGEGMRDELTGIIDRAMKRYKVIE
jgi:hypothetical protein